MSVLDLSSPVVQTFYRETILAHTLRTVQHEPEKPSNWSRPSETTQCYGEDCPDCSALNEFLLDPQCQSRTFSELKSPWHFYSRACRKCDSSTDESTKPITVVVTKTLKAFEREPQEMARARGSVAQKTYHRLPQQQLKRCLGEEGYLKVMTLQAVKIMTEQLQVVMVTRCL